MLVRASILVLSILPTICQAGWVSSEIKDEMRSSSTQMYTQEASPINGSGPKLTVRVFDKGDGAPSAMLDLSRARVEGCPERGETTCELEVRFGDGTVKKVLFSTEDGKQFIPTEMGAFFGALYHGDKLFVEMHVDGYPYQYRFTLDRLPTKYDQHPDIEILGFKLGSKYEAERPTLEASKVDGDKECFWGENTQDVFKGTKVEKVSICFYKGVFYQAIITPGNQAAYQAGYSLVVKAFGKPDPDGVYPRWPDDKDLRINRNIRSAAYMAIKKGDYKAPFLITDDSWDLLVPASK